MDGTKNAFYCKFKHTAGKQQMQDFFVKRLFKDIPSFGNNYWPGNAIYRKKQQEYQVNPVVQSWGTYLCPCDIMTLPYDHILDYICRKSYHVCNTIHAISDWGLSWTKLKSWHRSWHIHKRYGKMVKTWLLKTRTFTFWGEKYRVTTDGGAEKEDITARLAFIDLQYILVYQHK